MITNPISSSTTTSTGTLSSSSVVEQQDRFMKLLVAQMRNQDPLNPMDNAQMTSQIAQINTVGGIEKLNKTVESLLSSFKLLQAQGAAQLPGREVLVKGVHLNLSNGGATGGVEIEGNVEILNIDIVNASGAIVRTVSLGKSGAGIRSFAWDGLSTGGQVMEDGRYTMRVTAQSSGKPVAATLLTAARVQSVANTATGTQVDLGSAGVVGYDDIKSFL